VVGGTVPSTVGGAGVVVVVGAVVGGTSLVAGAVVVGDTADVVTGAGSTGGSVSPMEGLLASANPSTTAASAPADIPIRRRSLIDDPLPRNREKYRRPLSCSANDRSS